ncbi:copper resistance D family protein [Planococcus sp. 4-30]|uniref:copper resistance D family protein n=1 Tax=Planococcus sp. 4-30 TaxID=2874583 RepID=UPI001CC08ECB|nr:CopD family protein [Planococcus sp. 4-30]
MTFFTAFADVLLYIAFSYLAGYIVLQFVPEDRKPPLAESKILLLLSATGIVLLSFFPVYELVVFLQGSQGWGEAWLNAITGFRIGQGWLITLLLSIILSLTIYFGGSRHIQGLYLFLLILTVGFYSHISTLDLWTGFALQSIHILFLSMWAGVLLHVAWFTKDGANWRSFLAWFTPFAFFCVAAVIASGIVIMFFFVAPSDYANSWALPYGQLLLLKHISIIPVLLAALINGFLNKQKVFQQSWLKLESVLLLVVFVFTAFMSKQAPPHDVNDTLRIEGGGWFIEQLAGPLYIPLTAGLDLTLNGSLLMGLSLLLLALMLLGFSRQLNAWLSLLFGIGFIICFYAGLMLSLSF